MYYNKHCREFFSNITVRKRGGGKESESEVGDNNTSQENILPVSLKETEPVVFKVPAVRRQTITVPFPNENTISIAESISNSEIIPSHRTTSVGHRLPGSVTVACVTACEKSSNPRQKVAIYFST